MALSTAVEILKSRWNVFLKDLLYLKCTDLGKWPALYKRSEKIIAFILSGQTIRDSTPRDARTPLQIFSLSVSLFLNFLPPNNN